MEKYYFLSESLLDLWEEDLILEQNSNAPSQKVIDAIIEYSLMAQVYSPTLKKNIAISLN